MKQKTVHVAVYDTYADWEVGHATAHIRNGEYQAEPGRYGITTVGPGTAPVTTMGGLRILPELALADLDPADSAMLILPGAAAWDESPETLAPFARAARAFTDNGVPVAAICGATAGIAREGLLDDRPHTSAVADYLAATGYKGGGNYRDADAVRAGGVITAGPTDQVAFAREVFAELGLYRPEVLDAWYRLFAHSDPSAFAVLATA